MISLVNSSYHGLGFTEPSPEVEALPVDVGIPVHNALGDVKRCLTSVISTATPQTRVVIVDDGSDRPTREWLERFVTEHGLELIVNDRPLGYTRAANAILEASRGRYVVLLNSDTITTPGWIQAILRCGESSPGIGVVGPLSNAASWQSVPDLYNTLEPRSYAVNSLPSSWSAADLAFAIHATPAVRPPRVPLVNGFCYTIKRDALDTVGRFDDKRFPLGYGEEDDYTFRAWDAGFSAALAMDAYVFHAKSQSFRERVSELRVAGGAAFRDKWSNRRVEDAVRTMRQHPVLQEKRRLIREIYSMASVGFSASSRPVLEVMDGSFELALLVDGLEDLGVVVERFGQPSSHPQTSRNSADSARRGDHRSVAQRIVLGCVDEYEHHYAGWDERPDEGGSSAGPRVRQRLVVPLDGPYDHRVRRVAAALLLLSLAAPAPSSAGKRRASASSAAHNPEAVPSTDMAASPSGSSSCSASAPLVSASTTVAVSARDPYLLRFDATADEIASSKSITDRFRSDPRTDLSAVTWFVPAFDHVLRGGLRTIFSVAADLYKHHGTRNTFVLCADQQGDAQAVASHVADHFPGLAAEYTWHRYGDRLTSLPAAGVGICTLWTTAYVLLRYNQCDAKFYFVQDWEPSFYAAGSRSALIEQTYRFGFVILANSQGVAERCSRFEDWVGHFTPGVDHTVFFPSADASAQRPYRVVFYGRPRNERNGFALGTEALRRVKSQFGAAVDLVSVGAEYQADAYGLKGVVRNLGVLQSLEDVAGLYRTCHIGLVFMYTAHPSYQPLEYMASGCATVTNHNPSNAWLLRDKQNCIIAPSTVSGVTDALCDLLADSTLRERLARAGVEAAKALSWEDAFASIRSFLAHPRRFTDRNQSVDGPRLSAAG